MNEAPIIRVSRDQGREFVSVLVECPNCFGEHTHGLPINANGTLWRVPHCKSLYKRKEEYVITDAYGVFASEVLS